MVIFRGERMPGASRTARSALRVRGHRGGVPAGSARLRVRGCGLAAAPRPVGFRP